MTRFSSSSFGCLLLFVALCHGVQGAQWSSGSPPDGLEMFVCRGNTVTLAWQYVLSAGDVLGDIQWLYDGHSEEMIAMTAHGHFVVLPAFGNRVTTVGNAGLSITNMVVGDSGNYTVEIHVYANSGASHVLLRRSVYLRVSGMLMTTDGQLHLSQNQEVVLNKATNRFSIELQCGTFIFRHNPIFNVEWITPSGQVRNSSEFTNGQFKLLLDSPLQGGKYRCRIPANQASLACINSTSEGEATLLVDKMEAEVSLLLKENEQRQIENVHLQQRVQVLEDALRHTVAFHATHLASESPGDNKPLIFTTVHCNQGNAYNSATGIFLVPYDGLYFFASTTGPSDLNIGVYHSLVVDNSEITLAYTYKNTGTELSTIHGVVKLRAGQRVWIKATVYDPSNLRWFDTRYSTFTGFLLSHDM